MGSIDTFTYNFEAILIPAIWIALLEEELEKIKQIERIYFNQNMQE